MYQPPARWRAWYARAAELWPTASLVFAKPGDRQVPSMLPAVLVSERPRTWVFPPTQAEANLSVPSGWRMWYIVPLDELGEFATLGRKARERWRYVGLSAPKAQRRAQAERTHYAALAPEPWPAPWAPWAGWGDAQLYSVYGVAYAVVGREDQLGTVELPDAPADVRRGFWRWVVPPAELQAFRKAWLAAQGQGWHPSLRRWAVEPTGKQRAWARRHQRRTATLRKSTGIGIMRRGAEAVQRAAAAQARPAETTLPDLCPGMAQAYARTGVPQLVRYPWPAPYTDQYRNRYVALTWTPEGYALRAATPADTAWRERDPRASTGRPARG